MATPRKQLVDGPIPGMGLTHEVGGRPWQKPPQYNTVEEALEYYIPRFSDPKVVDQLLDVMELGIPLTTIADAMQSSAVMEGMHSIDVGLLAMPVLIEMMAYIGDESGVEYKLGLEERIDDDEVSDTKIALAMKKVREEMPERLEEARLNAVPKEEPAEEMVTEEEPMEKEAPELGGLMARRA
tara:strand:- start:1056 stop:1604 length:549 start_codon:yes stop_codon:yes gene_type:complete